MSKHTLTIESKAEGGYANASAVTTLTLDVPDDRLHAVVATVAKMCAPGITEEMRAALLEQPTT